MAGKHSEYFDALVKQVDYSCQAAIYLNESLEKFDPITLSDRREKIHEIEHAADNCKHEMMKKLSREFITPLEREDIIQLAQEIDEVTDLIEDVLLRIYMYNIQSVRPEALSFTAVIVRCCKALKTVMEEFQNYKKSERIQPNIIEINSLEEEGDRLYIEAVRRLYVEGKDAVEIMAWTETFDRLEGCCDACEHVANVVESVIMKNS